MWLASVALDSLNLIKCKLACILREQVECITLFENGVKVDSLEDVKYLAFKNFLNLTPPNDQFFLV